MLAIFFLIAGIYMIAKQEVKISSKRTISGKNAKKLGLIYLIPAIFSFLPLLIPIEEVIIFVPLVSILGYAVAIIVTIYLVFFYKSEK